MHQAKLKFFLNGYKKSGKVGVRGLGGGGGGGGLIRNFDLNKVTILADILWAKMGLES